MPAHAQHAHSILDCAPLPFPESAHASDKTSVQREYDTACTPDELMVLAGSQASRGRTMPRRRSHLPETQPRSSAASRRSNSNSVQATPTPPPTPPPTPTPTPMPTPSQPRPHRRRR
eukprot:3750035-Pleurochrysis_carterae.AAC.1